MDLSVSANAAVTDDALATTARDASGFGASVIVHIAIGLVRVSAVAALASPLLLAAWLVL